MISNILAPFDLFKVPIDIYFNGKYLRSSLLGSVCSLLIFTYLIFQFSTSEFFEKKSPNVVMQSLKQSNAKRIDFNFQNPLIMAVADYSDTYHKLYDPSIFNVMIVNSNNGKLNLLETKRCAYEDLPVDKIYFNKMNLENTFCLKNKTFFLEGYIDETNLTWLQIYVYPCNNFTSMVTCRSQEEIDSFWKGKAFSAIHYNAEIDAKDLEQPFRTYLEPYTLNLDPSLTKAKYHIFNDS